MELMRVACVCMYVLCVFVCLVFGRVGMLDVGRRLA